MKIWSLPKHENLTSGKKISLTSRVQLHIYLLNEVVGIIFLLSSAIVLGFNDTLTLVGHFVSSPREREKREEIAEEMKERDREERGTGMKVKKQKKLKHHLPTLTCYKGSRPCPTVSQYQLDAPVT